MVRDVYAGDEPTSALEPQRTASFTIIADCDPMIVVRVAQLLAIPNAAPSEFHMRVGRQGLAEIRATLTNISAEQCDCIRRKLSQLLSVYGVDVAEHQARPVPSLG
jgi:hypothetical protein